MFLTKEDLLALTGKSQKGKQIAQLRRMGIPFYINAAGHPIVARSSIEGRTDTASQAKPWSPKVLGSQTQR